MLLFALAMQNDADLLPTHTTNRLYRDREELVLMVAELDLWLRSLVADVARADSSGWGRVIPGWYLLTASPTAEGLGFANDLVEMLNDDNGTVVIGALLLLMQLGARPEALWSAAEPVAIDDRKTEEAPQRDAASRWVHLLSRSECRTAALTYLTHSLTSADTPLVTVISSRMDSDEDLAAIAQYADGNADALARSAANDYAIDTWKHEVLTPITGDLGSASLHALAAGEHSSNDLGKVAIAELARRQELTEEDFIENLASDDPARRDHVLAVVAAAGGALDDLLRRAVAALPEKLAVNDIGPRAEAVLSTLEKLRELAAVPVVGLTQWQALGWLGDPDSADMARTLLDTDAAAYNTTLEQFSDKHTEVADYVRAVARQAALRLLTRLPVDRRTDQDAERARAELARDHWLTRGSALGALGVLGESIDVPRLIQGSDKVYGSERGELLAAALRLGGAETAVFLASSRDPWKAQAGATWLAHQTTTTDAELMEMLYNEHGPVRLIALEGLRRRWDQTRLAGLLTEYPKRPGKYYYNVMAELDRLLYAPPPIAAREIVPSLA